MTDLHLGFLDHLVCPRDRSVLVADGNSLTCAEGHRYPVVDGVPVLLRDDVAQTIALAEASLRRAIDPKTADPRGPDLYLESLGVSEEEKQGIVRLAGRQAATVDPVVSFLVGGHQRVHVRRRDRPIGRIPDTGTPLARRRRQALSRSRLQLGKMEYRSSSQGI
jgi:uncharacterized protein YbaR (Trm112 family)